jgi:hypothetical protein
MVIPLHFDFGMKPRNHRDGSFRRQWLSPDADSKGELKVVDSHSPLLHVSPQLRIVFILIPLP